MMNKKILAAAVAAALTAPGLALAQTNVQVYGLFDIRVDQMRFTSNAANTVSSLNKYHVATGVPNRLGFRGTEALGSGLTAFFQIETQVFVDAKQDNSSGGTPNALVGGRPTFVGLRSSSLGEVSLGLQDTPYGDVWKSTWGVVPTQGHNGIIMNNGNSSGAMPSPNCSNLSSPATGLLTGGTAAQPLCQTNESAPTAFDRRLSNTILYRSPVVYGFRFAAMTAANEFKEPSSSTPANTNQFKQGLGSYALTWAGGPFSASVGYETHVGFRATNTAFTNRNAKDQGIELGARYNYGSGLIGVGFEELKYNNAGTAAADNSFKLRNWTVQGTFNITPADVAAVGYSKTSGARDCGVAVNCGSNTGAKMYTLSVDHNFSKRTGVYALYSKIDNNSQASYYYIAGPTSNAGGGGLGGAGAGVDVTLVGAGVKHTF